MTINVVTIEDDLRFRASLETLLRHSPGVRLAGSFGDPVAALAKLAASRERGETLAWDLALMDLELPRMTGIEATRVVKSELPSISVIILTVFEEPATVLEAICAGADGYLLKSTPADELLEQIQMVAAGGSPLTSGVARTVLSLVRSLHGEGPESDAAPSRLDLSEREQEVLRQLVAGLSYKQVATALDISLDTVRTHVRRIYGKLQVHSVAEAVSRAIREGLV